MTATADARQDGPEQPLDRLIHEPARLAIVTQLFVVESADATHLLRQTGLTWGNLSSHLSKLSAAGYVRVTKGFNGLKPVTMIELTDDGRAAFVSYRDAMLRALGSPPE